MSIRHTNLARRGGQYYYRAAFTLDGKTFSVRLSLKTTLRPIARERAAWMDRVLKGEWRRIVIERDGISEGDKASILRATALKARDSFEAIHANEQALGYDDPDAAKQDLLLTLRGLDHVARDIFSHGVGPSFGTFDHFANRFLGETLNLDGDQLERIREILSEGTVLTQATEEGAVKALIERNIDTTRANVVIARRQMMLGVLLAIREAEQQALAPTAQIETLLAGLEMPVSSPMTSSTHALRYDFAQQVSDNSLAGRPTVPLADSSVVLGHAEPAAMPSKGMTISGAAEAFLAANPKFDGGFASSRWTDKTRSQFESAIFLASKFFGPDVRVAGIDETMIAAFFRTLRRLPRNHHKTPAHSGMSLQEIAAGNTGDGLSLATTNRHIRFLKLVFDWAAKRMAHPPVIDWNAFVESDSRVKRDKRQAFAEAELETLFRGAVWTGSESKVRRVKTGPHIWHDSAYWVPILLVYTGARREEVCKALVDDIECLDGIWVLRIRVTEAGRVKTESSVRDVPIADEVLRLGFLDFVDCQKQTGNALFPELSTGGSSYGDAFYKKWWRAFMRAGLVPADKDMHSIRHFVATALAERDVSEERRADLLGHTVLTSETARTYTKRSSLKILRDVVNTIPNLTDHLRTQAIKLL